MTCHTDYTELVPRRQRTVAPRHRLGTRAWQRSGQGMAGTTLPARQTPVLQARNDHKCFHRQIFSFQLCRLAGSISRGCTTAHLPVWQLYPPFKGVKPATVGSHGTGGKANKNPSPERITVVGLWG
jgi:hypothetical protein